MNLSQKVNLFVALVFVALISLYFEVQQVVIMPSFISLEEEMAVNNAERVIEAINRELNQLSPIASDWAYWSTTYDYAKNKNEKYVKEVLVDSKALYDLNLNYIGIFDTDNNAIWSRAVNLGTESILNLGLLSEKELPANYPLIQFSELTDEVRGIIPTPFAPMLVVAKPILTSDNKGPAAGTFIMGKFLDDGIIKAISQVTKLPIMTSIPSLQDNSKKTQPVVVVEGLAHTSFETIKGEKSWIVNTTLIDLHNNPVLSLKITTPRDVSIYGSMAIKHSIWLLATAGLLIMFALWKFLQLTVIAPITKLTNHTIKIGGSHTLEEHIDITGNDEIGILSRNFNQMVDHLAESRKKIVDQSYRLGATNLASGTLHNVRNTITPLSVRLTTLQQDLQEAPLSETKQAIMELTDPNVPQERRVDLLQFLKLTTDELEKLLARTNNDISKSIQQISHIENLLVDRRLLAQSEKTIESISMLSVIKEVENRLSPKIKDSVKIQISDSLSTCGDIIGTKAALELVVENILVNAAESIGITDNEGLVIITAQQNTSHEHPMVEFLFADNGAGVAHSHIDHIFERDFSTKDREGAGFGLHWSANTIEALGGRILIKSPGLGHGATVHVLLPLA